MAVGSVLLRWLTLVLSFCALILSTTHVNARHLLTAGATPVIVCTSGTCVGSNAPELFLSQPGAVVSSITIEARGGDDTIVGSDNIGTQETLKGEDGDDNIFGVYGDDIINGGPGADYLDGGGGNDQVSGGPGNDFLGGSEGDDQLAGNDGDDQIIGDSGSDILLGGAGDDLIDGSGGDDGIDGGPGDDQLLGYYGDDVIYGGEGSDYIDGEDGDDILYGNDGDDLISGGFGSDIISGGAGGDAIFSDGDGQPDDIYPGSNNGVNFDTIVSDNLDTVFLPGEQSDYLISSSDDFNIYTNLKTGAVYRIIKSTPEGNIKFLCFAPGATCNIEEEELRACCGYIPTNYTGNVCRSNRKCGACSQTDGTCQSAVDCCSTGECRVPRGQSFGSCQPAGCIAPGFRCGGVFGSACCAGSRCTTAANPLQVGYCKVPPSTGQCVFRDKQGNVQDNSTKECYQCQLQCLQNQACATLTFQGETLTQKQLLTYQCPGNYFTTQSRGLCVLLDKQGKIVDSSEKSCTECVQQCSGWQTCGTMYYNFVEVPKNQLANYCGSLKSPSPASSPLQSPAALPPPANRQSISLIQSQRKNNKKERAERRAERKAKQAAGKPKTKKVAVKSDP